MNSTIEMAFESGSHVADLGFTNRSSKISYSPLNEDQNEIRLISFVRESRESSLVHCNLVTISLKSYTPEYQTYASSLGSTATKRKVLAHWARIKFSTGGLANPDDMNSRVPIPGAYRFQWGDYAALSYVWGDENATSTIVINGRQTPVTTNVEVALRALRGRSDFEDGFKLWVDALCINQADFEERECQVKKMHNIYGNAWTVIAWLGEEENNSEKAITLIKALSTAGREGRGEELRRKLVEEPEYLGDGSWLALQELMRRPYWARLWIIQEIVLGSSGALIRCGDSCIGWVSFCTGIEVLFNHLWILKDELLQRDIALCMSHVNPRWETPSLHLVHKDLRLLSQREEHGGDHLGFERLLDIANTAISRDVRDKVYGMLGMMDPVIAKQLTPDYRLDPARIFTAVTKVFILTYGNLEPLRESNPWGQTQTPSWAADWTWDGRLPYSRPEDPPFWTAGHTIQETGRTISYHASEKTVPTVSFSNNDFHLTCRGFLIDKIAGLSARGLGFFQWLRKSIIQPDSVKSIYGDVSHTSRALYLTLVADRVWNGIPASDRHAAILSIPSTFAAAEPQFRERGWKSMTGRQAYYYRWEWWRATNEDFLIGGQRLHDYFTDEIPKNALEDDYAEAYSCFDRTSKGRRLMTTTNGYLGWAPDNIYGSDEDQTRKDDLICIIFGCSNPIVIRPYGKLFKVVGEAYVHGLMEGEAMKFLETGGYQVQDFTFC
jgi:hypothetical protein